MSNIFDIRDFIEETVSRYETLIKAAVRFFLALISLSVVNGKLGYMERLDSTTVVVAVSLLCALLPTGMIIFFSALFTVLHCYALSLETAVVVLAVFLLMFLLYFRFTPKDTLAVLLTPLSFVFRIPFVMPVIYGLKGTPLSALSVGFGVIAYFTVDFVSDSEKMIQGMSEATTVERFRAILDGVMKNNVMIAYIIAFAFKLFTFSVDYAKTERVQFEDDGYYYYVKAIPKIKSHRKRTKTRPSDEE